MKRKRLTIRIRKSPSEVFAFTLNPKNTPKWVKSIVREKTNEWPVKVGSVYRNQNKRGIWSEYRVVRFEPDRLFEFVNDDIFYHVRYTLKPISNKETDLEYYEWMEEGELEEPFTLDILKKLKSVMEK